MENITKTPSYSRIHYKRTGKDDFLMSKMYQSAKNGQKYRVSLYLDTLDYYVFEAPCGQIVTNGDAESESGLKKAAKAALVDLGVIFTS